MKLKIYKKEENKAIKVKLQQDVKGNITLSVVDDEGNTKAYGYLLKITNKGTLQLFKSISKKFGFQLDNQGRIVIVKDK